MMGNTQPTSPEPGQVWGDTMAWYDPDEVFNCPECRKELTGLYMMSHLVKSHDWHWWDDKNAQKNRPVTSPSREELGAIVDGLINWATDFMAGDDVDSYTHIVDPRIPTVPRTKAIESLLAREAGIRAEAEQRGIHLGRIAAIDEYVAQCNVLRVEPNRRSLALFQAGQQTALDELERLNKQGEKT